MIVTLGLVVSLVASLGALLRIDASDEARDASNRTAALLATISVPTSLLLTQGRVADLDNLMSELARREYSLDLDRIILVDHEGVVLAETADRRSAERFGQNIAELDPFVGRAIAADRALQDPPPPARPERVSVPVQTGIRWGTLIGTLSTEKLEARLAERRMRLVASALSVTGVGLAALLLLLSVEVLQPLRDVVRMAQRLARGDLSARASVHGKNELAILASTLNDAAVKLGRTKDQLEEDVARRTEELQKANDELRDANVRLERLAITDPLTGLFNRRYLEQALVFEVTRQRRGNRPFSLLMIDVDNFKHYNDTNGHPAGDEVLRQLSKILAQSLRASDIVARYGGEEFVVLLLDTDMPMARAAAEKVRDYVRGHPFAHGDRQPLGRVTISVGAATWPAHGESADAVLEAADRALYASKHAGRDRVTAAGDKPGCARSDEVHA